MKKTGALQSERKESSKMKRQQQQQHRAVFGLAYDPASHLGFGHLEPLDFRVQSMGDEYFM